MTESFAVHLFYPDGGAPESGEQVIADLSPKWLSVCSEVLDHYGPVFDHNMGSTLAHLDMRMGGPVGQLLAYGHVCFDSAVSLGAGSAQDRATVDHFRQLLERVAVATGKPISTEALDALSRAPTGPMLLLFDRCTPEVENDQKQALMDLAVHFAGAYYRYCESEPLEE